MMRYEDSVITEVRKNREELLAEFGGDRRKLAEHLISQRPAMEAAGVRYETDAERQARFAWNSQQRESEELRVANL
jgi:hypothetical protein